MGSMNTLGKRLKHVRDNVLKLSQAKLAAKLEAAGVQDGTTSVSVMRYEKDERIPGADYVREVAKLGKVSAGWLLTGEGNEKPAPQEGAGVVRSISVDERAEVLALLDEARNLLIPPASEEERLHREEVSLRRYEREKAEREGAESNPDRRARG